MLRGFKPSPQVTYNRSEQMSFFNYWLYISYQYPRKTSRIIFQMWIVDLSFKWFTSRTRYPVHFSTNFLPYNKNNRSGDLPLRSCSGLNERGKLLLPPPPPPPPPPPAPPPSPPPPPPPPPHPARRPDLLQRAKKITFACVAMLSRL